MLINTFVRLCSSLLGFKRKDNTFSITQYGQEILGGIFTF